MGPSARPLKYCLVSPWPWCGWAWGTGAGGGNGQFQGPDLHPPSSPPLLPQPLSMLLADITNQLHHCPAHPRQPQSLASEPRASIRLRQGDWRGVSAQDPPGSSSRTSSSTFSCSPRQQPHPTAPRNAGEDSNGAPCSSPFRIWFNPKHEGGWARKGFGFIPLDAQDLARAPGRRGAGAWLPASTNKGFLY